MNIVFDLSNMVWAIRYAEFPVEKKGRKFKKAPFSKELIMLRVLESVTSNALKNKATGALIACDSANWRKDVYPQYKANRELDHYYEEVKEAMNDITEFFNEYTNIPAIAVEKAEADDIVSVACDMSPVDVTIVSTDKDFIQLLQNTGNKKVKLYSPVQKEYRTHEDPQYALFEKCIRGDRGDNIKSAFPRVRSTKLQEAWENPAAMMELMETITPDGVKVGTAYAENKKLMDLSMNNLPVDVRDRIRESISSAANRTGRYNYLNVVKFLSNNSMKNLAKEINNKGRVLKLGFVL